MRPDPRILLAAAALALLPGCDRSNQPGDPSAQAAGYETAPAGEPTHVYEGIRGVIVELPSGTTKLRIHHEAIPTFISPQSGELHQNPDGTPGMKEMVMPMPLVPSVSLDGIEAGDKVAFTLAVWTGLDTAVGFAYRVTELGELGPDEPVDITP